MIPSPSELRASICRDSLADFVRQAWPILEPDTELVWNWHIDAICSHLEAVTRGRIKKLLVCIPPGHMKSLLVSVFWPAWEWLAKPGERTLFGSYDMGLSTRDSVKCRQLITSDWYRGTFRPGWRLRGDQNVKTWFENTAGGLRLALAVGGRGTGFRGHCIRGDMHVSTEFGAVPIRKFEALTAWPRVWTYDSACKRLELRRVLAVQKTRGRRVCRIDTGFGRSLYCTHEHQIFSGGGFLPATDCSPGCSVGALCLPGMPRAESETGQDLLGMFSAAHRREEAGDLCRMRNGFSSRGICETKACASGAPGSILLPAMFCEILQSAQKNKAGLQDVRGGGEKRTPILQQGLSTEAVPPYEKLSAMRGTLLAEQFPQDVLWETLRRPESFFADAWERELEISGWGTEGGEISADAPVHYRAGSYLLRGMFEIPGKEDYEARHEGTSCCASHRRKPGERFSGELDLPLCRMSLESPSFSEQQIVGLDRDCPGTHDVYDLQVEGSHNFFAEGLLVHNCIVFDDPLNVKRSLSDEEREEAKFWWDKRMSSRLNDPRTGVRVGIMQRLHEDDLAGHLIARGGYEVLSLPTEFDPEKRCATSLPFEDPRRVRGELLFKEMYPPEVVAEIKVELGSFQFAGQHNQNPVPLTGGVVKKHWLKFWYRGKSAPRPVACTLEDGSIHMCDQARLPDGFDEVFTSSDMAFKDRKDNDYVAMGAWGVVGAKRYMLDLVWDHLSFVNTLAQLRLLRERFPACVAHLVEDKANGPAIINVLENEIPELLAIEPHGSKIARCEAVAPTIEAGNLWLPHPDEYPWMDSMLLELCTFPKSKHDDRVDQLTQALNWLRTRDGEKIFFA